MVGSRSEHGGIIKDGAKLVNVMANSVVPKITLYVGNSFGAGNYAMCGKAYDPRFLFAWPSAQVAVMSGAAAANTLLQIEKATLQAKGEVITPENEKALFEKIKDRYDMQTSPYFAAARLWIDELVLPSETRTHISMGLEAANHAPVTREFSAGVLQT
jgi:acetyl-CoA carboxylase carboxyltransferase component